MTEISQPSVLEGTPWGGAPPPAASADHFGTLAVLGAARPASTAPMAPQPAGLTSALHKYQRRALCWMVAKEEGSFETWTASKDQLNPAWSEYRFPGENGATVYMPKNRAGKGLLTLRRPVERRWTHAPGGVLADEMGLGKTIEVIAVILTRPRDPQACRPLATDMWPLCMRTKTKRALQVCMCGSHRRGCGRRRVRRQSPPRRLLHANRPLVVGVREGHRRCARAADR